jgi:hypothetical protein
MTTTRSNAQPCDDADISGNICNADTFVYYHELRLRLPIGQFSEDSFRTEFSSAVTRTMSMIRTDETSK